MSVESRRARYEEIADDLRRKISSGAYPVDSALPSIARLMAEYGVSATVVQRAVRELKHEGLAVGQPGRAVYVQRQPEPAAPSPEFVEIMGHVKALQDALATIETRLTALEKAARKPRSRPRAR